MEKFNLEEAKKEYIKNIKNYMSDTGSMFPHISIFGTEKDTQKKSIVHVPIPEEYMSSSKMKDEFVDDILPLIVKKVNEKFTTEAVGWASEAWMSTFDEKTKKPSDKRKEVLFIILSTEDGESVSLYDIERTGKQVNQEGELVDIIELTENTAFDSTESHPMAGRFANLYRKFKESLED